MIGINNTVGLSIHVTEMQHFAIFADFLILGQGLVELVDNGKPLQNMVSVTGNMQWARMTLFSVMTAAVHIKILWFLGSNFKKIRSAMLQLQTDYLLEELN